VIDADTHTCSSVNVTINSLQADAVLLKYVLDVLMQAVSMECTASDDKMKHKHLQQFTSVSSDALIR
jgi:hypothetical protein